MKVRRSRIKGPVEIVAVGLEHATKIQNLKIKDGLLSAFDFGERAAADVQTCKLKLSRKPFLRPPAFVAQSPNLRSYDIAVPHRARATQAPIAKGQLALTWFVSNLPQLVTKQPFSVFRHRIVPWRFSRKCPKGGDLLSYFSSTQEEQHGKERGHFSPSEKVKIFTAHRTGRREAYTYLKEFVLDKLEIPDWPLDPMPSCRE